MESLLCWDAIRPLSRRVQFSIANGTALFWLCNQYQTYQWQNELNFQKLIFVVAAALLFIRFVYLWVSETNSIRICNKKSTQYVFILAR